MPERRRRPVALVGVVAVAGVVAYAVSLRGAAGPPASTGVVKLSAELGGETDDEGCYTSAGYSWCAASSSCVRSWESSCDWVNTKVRASPDATVSLLFALPVSEDAVARLEAEVEAVSDPSSSRYGAHLSKAGLDAYRASVHPEWASHAATIRAHLAKRSSVESEGDAQRRTRWSSVEDASVSGFFRAELSIGAAEALLDAEYYEFERADGAKVARTTRATIPEALREAVALVEPTTRFPTLKRQAQARPNKAQMPKATDGKFGVTPGILRDEYGMADAYPTLVNRSEHYIVVTAFDGEFASPKDAQKFLATYAPEVSARGFEPTIVGPNRGNRPGAEANLDVQYASAVSGGVPTEVWSFAGMSPDSPAINEPFLEFVLYMNGVDHAPSVVSTSYGEDEGSTSDAYAVRVQYEFGLAALRGMSLLFASGDSGVSSTWGACDHFYAQWPSGSPYVTAVGATVAFGDNEQVASFSSGGFSNRWARPAYQREAVEAYLSTARDVLVPYIAHGRLPADLFNASGRAFPDVAAAGEDFAIVYDREVGYVSGTSCSAPTFAGVVGLLNDARLAAGKSKLGFLNPFIYKYRSAFDDVLLGNNGKCGTDGFRALKGWDPASGFGSPAFDSLLEAAMAV